MIRHAEQGDLGELVALDPLAAAGDAQRCADLTRAVDQDICLLVTDGHVVQGFVVVRPGHFFGRDFVDLLMVSPGHRRKGLGKALMRMATASAGSPQVFTSTNESNAPMQALLESEGWTLSGQLDGLDAGDPELVYYLRR